MVLYSYSRSESIGRTTLMYQEYLKILRSKILHEHDVSAYKNLLYHACCMNTLPKDLNEKIVDVAVKMSKEADMLEEREKWYLKKACIRFVKSGSHSLIPELLRHEEDEAHEQKKNPTTVAPIKEALSRKFNSLHSIQTSELLEALFLCNEKNSTETFSEYSGEYLFRLLRKFEVTGKIYEKYTHDFKRLGETYDRVENYVLLAVNLLKFYKDTGNLKVLNGVLKLNDMLAFLTEQGIVCEPLSLTIFSFIQEEYAIRGIYADRGFRMSAY